ncbi:DUF5605 domain-containing protein [Metabacillus halosaccharovorans]|uniref:DUF5605 domain-containing protein n=1 Tax=Metabacillus halosaccharovorans TaxID=930124 RepID=UPI001C1F8AA7|nr:DUF5605 domain-containing protein [Metabacillus halosaccharovorans]MBU7591207.1 DUF5060 domain-containing protein [Metabacillus halosaccharovorans]
MDKQKSIECWDRFEVELDGPDNGNPFVDIPLRGTFSIGNRAVTADGFYDGNGKYKIRFMPDTEGEWTFTTSSNHSSLNELTGSFTCTPPKGNNHGPVQVADQTHFQYADGTPYYPFGTTVYVWNHQGEELENQTLESLKNAPFNKIRMCVFPKHYDYNLHEPVDFAFVGSKEEGFDYTQFNPSFFHRLEKQIDDLRDMGIETDLIIFHPYDRWGFSDMGKEADDCYLTYLVARLASFRNIWWSFANEFDLMKSKKMDDWDRFFKLVQEKDPAQHLRSIHNWHHPTIHYRNNNHWYDHNKPWVTHASIQHPDMYFIKEWRETFRKPIINDECRYEGNINHGWGNITAKKMVELFWDGVCSGGYVTHGETYMHPEGIIWWSHGGKLHGESPERIAFLRTILEEGPAKRLTPIDFSWDVSAGNIDDEYILAYFGQSRPSFNILPLPKGNQYKVELIDTWEMSITPLEGLYTDESRIDLPGKPYMALRITKDLS